MSASGSVWLRLRKYENPSGKADNGHCCDGKWGICQRSGCDYMFYVCLGYEERYSGNTTDTDGSVKAAATPTPALLSRGCEDPFGVD